MPAMYLVPHLTTLIAIATVARLSSTASAPPVDYGYWDVNVTSGNAASEYRWGDISVHNNIMITSDNSAFGSSQVDYAGQQPIHLWQNVTFAGIVIRIDGFGVVTMKCGLGAVSVRRDVNALQQLVS
ncbi:hypothetical protein CONLIGDRAFT_679237 [Coniochaeta ligniaria NRRL 30616]|uniref:Uncharacterized protein n=1 Tax=Coniochaeta ligniaria NRRL 30616 TaxID=1408157 RepID=A0A1J7JMA9_9PEZI|nr:hypothetical protein CONLIGDRAFT_679237 [Coniochaeta ligniaria NRRL 30616]